MLLRGVCALVAAVGLGLALGGCLDDPGVTCTDGTVCPDGTTCRSIVGTTHCVSPAQAAECAGQGDGGTCTLTGGVTGVCNQGVCLRVGCGDGFLSPGEKCDGSLLGGETCADRGYYRGDLGCTSDCAYDESQCTGVCGDGVRDAAAGEECDGDDLGGADCTAGGYYAAAGLGCSARCRLDFTACTGGRCGDGVKNGDEACDGSVEPGFDNCAAFGFHDEGPVVCTSLCQYGTQGCTGGRCGDGTKDDPEECDGGDTGGASCMSLGYYGGNLDCTSTCFYNLDQCHQSGMCGDGILQVGPEECDAGPTGGDVGDFGGQSCATASLFNIDHIPGTGAGRYQGVLGCTPDCHIDTAGGHSSAACADYCGDGILNGPEPCDAGADGQPDQTSDDVYFANVTCRSYGYQAGELKCTLGCTQIDLTGCSQRCGDGVIQGAEACDGAAHSILEASCGTFGEHGAVGCDSYCQVDTATCESSAFGAVNLGTVAGVAATDAVIAMWSGGPRDAWALLGAPAGTSRVLARGDASGWAAVTPAYVTGTLTALGGAGTTLLVGDATGHVAAFGTSGWIDRGTPTAGAIAALWSDGTLTFAVVQTAAGGELWRATGTTTWTRETLPGALTTVTALRGLSGGRLYVLGVAAGAAVFYERSTAGAWSSSPPPSGATYRGLWVGSPELIWALGGTPGASPTNVIAQRVRGVWQTASLQETVPTGTAALLGTLVGAGGEPDNLWLAGFDGGRAWLVNYTGSLTGVTRQVGPYGAFVGLADSGHGELWAYGAGLLVAHRDGAGFVAPQQPGLVSDTATVLGRFASSNVTSVAVTAGDVWMTALPTGSLPQPLFLVRHRPDQPLGQTPEARWETPLLMFAADKVVARTATEVWAFSGPSNGVRRWNGSAWTVETVPFAANTVTAAVASGGVLWVATNGTRALYRNAGAGWTTVTAWPDGFDATVLAVGPTGDVWVGGAGAAIDRWSGAAWTSYPQPTAVVRGIYVGSVDDVWAIGDDTSGTRTVGALVHRGPGAAGFTAVPGAPIIPGALLGLWGASPSDLWAVGEVGTILHYDGFAWVPISAVTATTRALLAVHGASRDAVWAVGANGALERLTAALPPAAPPPCIDAIPLYCSGLDHDLVGTVPAGGTATYRFETPFAAQVTATVAAAVGLTATLTAATADGRCTTVGGVASPAILAGHRIYYLTLAPTTPTSVPVGYQLSFTCQATSL